MFRRAWTVYSGGSFAPFGSVREDGFRLRVVAGYGDYGTGRVSFADVLVGYHAQLGPVTLKVLAGVTGEYRVTDQPLMDAPDAGLGGKVVIESWWNITDQAWTSADIEWSSLHSAFGARLRLGWRFLPELSAGLEGGSTGALVLDAARFGGFVRYEWATGELWVSGGLALDGPGSDWEAGPYAAVSVVTRF